MVSSEGRSQKSAEIAVVIPTRDRLPLLRVVLGCVLAQNDVDVHLVVVDDGSVDATPHELRALDDDRISVVRHDRPKGVSAARNAGFAQVDAPWVAFLDDDDVWAPDYLAAMLGAVQASDVDSQRVGLVFGGHLVVDGQWQVTGVSPAPPLEAVRHDMNKFNLVGSPSRVVLHTEAVRNVGGFDERLSLLADWDLWIRVLAKYEVVRCPELLVGYMLHAGNMHLNGDRFLEELAAIQAKYAWDPRPDKNPVHARRSSPGDMLPAYVASAYRASGRPVRAARWYLRSFRIYRSWRDLGRAVGVLFGERIIDLSGLRKPKAVDPSLGRWLEHVRQAAGVTTAGLPPMHGIRNSAEAR
jgi:glycosyltransferase involved in cell wall biosynthesis